jgi:hypothetical protein
VPAPVASISLGLFLRPGRRGGTAGGGLIRIAISSRDPIQGSACKYLSTFLHLGPSSGSRRFAAGRGRGGPARGGGGGGRNTKPERAPAAASALPCGDSGQAPAMFHFLTWVQTICAKNSD